MAATTVHIRLRAFGGHEERDEIEDPGSGVKYEEVRDLATKLLELIPEDKKGEIPSGEYEKILRNLRVINRKLGVAGVDFKKGRRLTIVQPMKRGYAPVVGKSGSQKKEK